MKKRTLMSLTLTVLAMIFTIAPLSVTAQNENDIAEIKLTTTEDGAFGFFLPEGWAFEGSREDGLTIVSYPELLELMEDDDYTAQSGDLAIQVVVIPEEQMGEFSLAEFLELVTRSMAADAETNGEPFEFSEVQEFDFEERPAAIVKAHNDTLGASIIMFPLSFETNALAMVGAAPNELENMTDLALSLLDIVRYSPPLEENFDDGMVEFDYPADWVVMTNLPFYGIANDPIVFEAGISPEEGQIHILLVNLAELGIDVENLSLVEETLAFAEPLLGEELMMADPVFTIVNEITTVNVSINEMDGHRIGGVFVVEFATLENVVYGIAYVTAPDGSYLFDYTAFNILMSLQIVVE